MIENRLKDLTFKVFTNGLEKATTGSKRIIRGYASVSDILDRQNEVITHGALEKAKDDLLRNHTIFYEHKHSELPVGKTIAVDLDDKGLLITVEFTQSKSGDDIWTLIEEGILNSFSIGGRVLASEERRDKSGNIFNEITELELLETSVVGLPANPAAKFELVSKSFGMAITEEMRKKGVLKKMSDKTKEVKEVIKEVNVPEVKEEVTIEKEENLEVSVSVEVPEKQDIIENTVSKEVSVEDATKVEDSAVEEKSYVTEDSLKSSLEEFKSGLLDSVGTLLKDALDAKVEDAKANLEVSSEEVNEVEEAGSVEAKDQEAEKASNVSVLEVHKEESADVTDEKSSDELILDKLSCILEALDKNKEVKKEEVKTNEAEVEAVVKSVEMERKGDAEVIIADAPYREEEDNVDVVLTDAQKKYSKDKKWAGLLYKGKIS